METVEQLAACHDAGLGAEARMASFLMDQFAAAGWSTERIEAPGRAALLGLDRAHRHRVRRFPLVIAGRAESPQAPGRVVLLTNLGDLAWQSSRLAASAGAALLLEMARTWPRYRLERFEPVLAAAGGMTCGMAGVRELVRLSEDAWRTRPTLLIMILAPGVGPTLAIQGQPRSMLGRATEAAESLWLPAQPLSWRLRMRLGRLWPASTKGLDQVVLAGSLSGADEDAFNQEALGRAAQLATEIALRWARQAAPGS